VVRGVGPALEFFDEPVLEQTLGGAVEGAGAQFELAAGARGDVLHDGVSVTLAVPQRDQDVEGSPGEAE
jgi:hypothetical protein